MTMSDSVPTIVHLVDTNYDCSTRFYQNGGIATLSQTSYSDTASLPLLHCEITPLLADCQRTIFIFQNRYGRYARIETNHVNSLT